jgi:hypothetical protein
MNTSPRIVSEGGILLDPPGIELVLGDVYSS